MDFYNTIGGKRFIEGTLPSIMKSLEKIANNNKAPLSRESMQLLREFKNISMKDFHLTVGGQRLINRTFPEIDKSLKALNEDKLKELASKMAKKEILFDLENEEFFIMRNDEKVKINSLLDV